MSTQEHLDAAIRWLNGMNISSPNHPNQAQRLAAEFEERDRAQSRRIAAWILSTSPTIDDNTHVSLRGAVAHNVALLQWYANEITSRWDKPTAPVERSSRDDKIGPLPRKTDQQIADEAHAAIEKLMVCRVCGEKSAMLVPLCGEHVPDQGGKSATLPAGRLKAAFQSRFGPSGDELASAIVDTVNDAVRGVRPAAPTGEEHKTDHALATAIALLRRSRSALLCEDEDNSMEIDEKVVTGIDAFFETCAAPATLSTTVPTMNATLRENSELRRILSKAVDAIGNGSCAAEWCSLEFLQNVPTEIAAQVAHLRHERDDAQTRITAQVAAWLRAGGPLRKQPDGGVSMDNISLKHAADAIERGEFRYRNVEERAPT